MIPLTPETIRLIFNSTLPTDQEAALLVLIVTTCCLGTDADPAALPFLDIVKNYPDPTAVNAALLTPEQAAALPALQRVFANAGGKAFYSNLNSLVNNNQTATQVIQSLQGVQAALADTFIVITNLNNIWADAPPHPKGASVGRLSF